MWTDGLGLGLGWLLAGLATAVVLGALVMSIAALGRRTPSDDADAVMDLWHRYEIGDLTRPEFDRLRRRVRAQEVSLTDSDSMRRAS